MTLAPVVHDRGVTTLTLDSPHNRNALSARLVGELSEALAGCADDDAVRAVVLTHTGNTFCAGADLTAPRTGGLRRSDAGDRGAAQARRGQGHRPRQGCMASASSVRATSPRPDRTPPSPSPSHGWASPPP